MKKSWQGELSEELLSADRSDADRGHHFRLLAREMKDYALLLIDPHGRIVQWNQGAEEIFGYKRKEVLGKPCTIIFTPEDRKRNVHEKELETAASKGRAQDKRWHLRKDRTRVWVDGVMMSLRDDHGRLRGFAKIARNDTEGQNATRALSKAHRLLERRVRERTADLIAANTALQDEISRRQQLENEILQISEREKRRIGQELHDSLCQELTAAAFLLQSLARQVGEGAPEGAALAEAAQIVNANVGLARDLARGLHPLELHSSGLMGALHELAFQVSGQVSCRFECPKPVRIKEGPLALNLYRIAQEAVNNALKHAKPGEIIISLSRNRDGTSLVVADDGTGIQPKKHNGMGIHIMTYRMDTLGGTISIRSRRGQGTTVSCLIPAGKKSIGPRSLRLKRIARL